VDGISEEAGMAKRCRWKGVDSEKAAFSHKWLKAAGTNSNPFFVALSGRSKLHGMRCDRN
jgi:cell division inhibitor SulA